MSLLDAAIVYLSLGAPTAVFHFFEMNKRQPLSDGRSRVWMWTTTAAVLFAWPPRTYQILRRQFGERARATAPEPSAVAAEKAAVLGAIKEMARAGDIFELRDIFERYVGITMEARETSVQGVAELYKIGGGNAEIGTICLNRRNAARLQRHQTDAACSLLTVIERAAEMDTFPSTAIERMANIAGSLGDYATETGLRRLVDGRGHWTKPKGESWKSELIHRRVERPHVQHLRAAASVASKSD